MTAYKEYLKIQVLNTDTNFNAANCNSSYVKFLFIYFVDMLTLFLLNIIKRNATLKPSFMNSYIHPQVVQINNIECILRFIDQKTSNDNRY